MTRGPEQSPIPPREPQTERKPLIDLPRSIIPACDVPDLDMFERIVKETSDVDGIGAYKVGLELVIPFGFIEVVRRAREYTDKPIIYDHQKGGNDIPQLGSKFMQTIIKSGADSAILFPFSSPVTQSEWTKALHESGLNVIVGGEMTHEQFLESQGGYIADSAPERIYKLGAAMGVRDFVVPGTKTESVDKYRTLLEGLLGEGNFTLYAPGFVAQGGNITDAGRVAGRNWHAIVGTAIYTAPDIKAAAQQLVSQIV
jgi:orotidine-5'-phosphate decarboxylase